MAAQAGERQQDAAEIFEALFTPAGRADPYPVYAALHDLGEAVRLGPGELVALSYEVVNAVLRDPAYLVTDADTMDGEDEHPSWFPGSLLSSNGQAHARMRTLLAGAFTPRRVAQLAPSIERIGAQLIAGMAELGAGGQPVDFMASFAYLLPVNVICELLGVPEADRASFRPEARKLALGIDFNNDPGVLAAADTAALWLQDYFADLAAMRRAVPADDLVSALVDATGADRHLSDSELLVNLTLLLFAGFETTTNLLGNGLNVMFSRPAIESGLRAGSISPEAFVTEVLRFDSPVQASTDRWRREPGQLAGLELPAGGHVIPLIGAANRDPRRFSAPDTFDPDRPDAGALSFGAGPHFCLGAALARLEGAVAFPQLLSSFSTLTAAGEPVRRQGLALRGFDKLPVAVA